MTAAAASTISACPPVSASASGPSSAAAAPPTSSLLLRDCSSSSPRPLVYEEDSAVGLLATAMAARARLRAAKQNLLLDRFGGAPGITPALQRAIGGDAFQSNDALVAHVSSSGSEAAARVRNAAQAAAAQAAQLVASATETYAAAAEARVAAAMSEREVRMAAIRPSTASAALRTSRSAQHHAGRPPRASSSSCSSSSSSQQLVQAKAQQQQQQQAATPEAFSPNSAQEQQQEEAGAPAPLPLAEHKHQPQQQQPTPSSPSSPAVAAIEELRRMRENKDKSEQRTKQLPEAAASLPGGPTARAQTAKGGNGNSSRARAPSSSSSSKGEQGPDKGSGWAAAAFAMADGKVTAGGGTSRRAGNSSDSLVPYGYATQSPIAAGAFSQVVRARHLTSGLEVAVKTFATRVKGGKQPPDLDTIHKEIEALKVLQPSGHAHIANLVQTFESDYELHAILEYCGGGSVKHKLNSQGHGVGLPEQDAANLTVSATHPCIEPDASTLQAACLPLSCAAPRFCPPLTTLP